MLNRLTLPVFVILLLSFNVLYSQVETTPETGISTEQILRKLPIKKQLEEAIEKWGISDQFAIFDIISVPATRDNEAFIEQAVYAQLSKPSIDWIRGRKPRTISIELPVYEHGVLILDLFYKDVFASDAIIMNSDGDVLPKSRYANYRGQIRGIPESVVGISFFSEEVIGVVSAPGLGNLTIGKMEGEDFHVIYSDKYIEYDDDFICNTDKLPVFEAPKEVKHNRNSGEDCIRLYLEADYNLYLDRGTEQAVQDWMAGVFNVVAVLYNNEELYFEISELFIWTTLDMYSQNSSYQALVKFKNDRQGFNGNLAHLIAKVSGQNNGGIAYLNVLCVPAWAFAYSNVFMSYQQYPTYSWTIMVISHEMGHNVGSQHTQWCGWPGGAIDNCYTPEGSCAPGPPPVNGGTIMSYCHITNHGINFEHGFGPLPGNTLRTWYNAAQCLDLCSEDCSNLFAEVTITHTTCGLANGALSFNISGGQSPYLVDIGNGPEEQTLFENLAAGVYQITITDDLDCEFEMEAVINSSSSPTFFVEVLPTTCGLNNGQMQIYANGGVGPYTYNIGFGPSSNSVFMNLESGLYFITVTDAMGCTETDVAFVPGSVELSANATVVHTSCGESNGSITVTAFGGNPPYQYNIGQGPVSNNVFNNLSSGIYSITVTDPDGCSDIVQATVNGSSGISATSIVTHTICGLANGSVTINAVSDFPPFTYSLDGNSQSHNVFDNLEAGVYAIIVSDNQVCTTEFSVIVNESTPLEGTYHAFDALCGLDQGSIIIEISSGTNPYQYNFGNGYQSNNFVENLAAGTYEVNIIDGNNCELEFSVEIGSTEALQCFIYSDPAHCGESNGLILVEAFGGNGIYQYGIGGPLQNDPIFTNVAPGLYNVYVTDTDDCEFFQDIEVIEIPELFASINIYQNVSCYGISDGFAIAEAIGGEEPYYYSWSNGTSEQINDSIPAGTYTVSVSDLWGCQKTAQISIDEPLPFTMSYSSNNPSCNNSSDGSIQVFVSGGTFPYQYSIDGVNYQQSTIFNNLSAGVFTVYVKDDNNCIGNIQAFLNAPPAINLTLSSTSVSCFGGQDGSASVSSSGGTGNIVFQWSNGFTGEHNQQLLAGVYQVTATDANGCVVIDSVMVGAPAPITIQFIINQLSGEGANDGSIEALASGGVGSFQYLWVNGETGSRIEQLSPGIYFITVTDENGCVKSASAVIQEFNCNLTIDSFNLDHLNCFGDFTGSIDIQLVSGNEPFMINWSNGEETFSIDSLSSGSYIVTITDALGCLAIDTFQIYQPEFISLSILHEDVSCNGYADGVLNLIGTGGTGILSYSIDGIDYSANQTFENLQAGDYTVWVLDENNCSINAIVHVIEPEPLEVIVQSMDVSCIGATDGMVFIQVNGGTPGYQVLWEDGMESPEKHDLSPGVYTLEIIDANLCQIDISFSIHDIIREAIGEIVGELQVLAGLPYSYQVNDHNNVTYQWAANSGIIDGPDDNYSVTVIWEESDFGVLRLVIEDALSCNIILEKEVSINTNSSTFTGLEESIIIYPNPFKDFIDIEMINQQLNAEYRLLDISGVTLKTGLAFDKAKIYTTDLSPGFYVLQIGNRYYKLTKYE